MTIQGKLENVISKKNTSTIKESETSSDFTNLVETLNEMPSLDNVIDKTHIENHKEQIVASRQVKTGLFLNDEKAEDILFSENNFPFFVYLFYIFGFQIIKLDFFNNGNL